MTNHCVNYTQRNVDWQNMVVEKGEVVEKGLTKEESSDIIAKLSEREQKKKSE